MKRGRDEGQAATEVALVLPLVVMLLLLAVQVALVCRDQILVVHAAREAAREAAVDRRPEEVRAAALRAAGDLKAEGLHAETSAEGGSPGIVMVTLRYRSTTDVPLVGPLLPDVTLWAKAAMRSETGHALWKLHHGARNSAGTAS